MRIESRLKKLEKKVIPSAKTAYHTIFMDHGDDQDEAVKKYKAENNVAAADDFWIIQFVKPGDVVKNG